MALKGGMAKPGQEAREERADPDLAGRQAGSFPAQAVPQGILKKPLRASPELLSALRGGTVEEWLGKARRQSRPVAEANG